MLTGSRARGVEQGDQRAHRRERARRDVRLRAGQRDRRVALLARHVEGAAQRARDQVGAAVVAVRPGLPEAGDRREHEPRVQRAQRFVAEPERVQVARRKRLHDDVGASGQPLQDLASLGPRRIERDAPLTRIRVEEGEARVVPGRVAPERRDAPRRVAAGPLDLDHVGAHVGHQLAAVGARGVGQLEDPSSAQRMLARRPSR